MLKKHKHPKWHPIIIGALRKELEHMKVTADMKASEADNVGTMLGNKQRFIQLKLI